MLLRVVVVLCFVGFSSSSEEISKMEGSGAEKAKDEEPRVGDGLPSETQEVAVYADATDSQAAGTHYHDDHPEVYSRGLDHGHERDRHYSDVYKRRHGYNDLDSYHGSHHGDFGRTNKLGYEDKGGGAYYGNTNDRRHHADFHLNDRGHNIHDFGLGGHSQNGRKNKGFKNVYHKEEYGVSNRYYDDDDFHRHHDDGHKHGVHYGGHGAGNSGGSGYGGSAHSHSHGGKGVHTNSHYDSHGGRAGSYGTSRHHGDDSSYGQNNIHDHAYGHGGYGGSRVGLGTYNGHGRSLGHGGRYGHQGYERGGSLGHGGRYGPQGYGHGISYGGLGHGYGGLRGYGKAAPIYRGNLGFRDDGHGNIEYIDRYNDSY